MVDPCKGMGGGGGKPTRNMFLSHLYVYNMSTFAFTSKSTDHECSDIHAVVLWETIMCFFVWTYQGWDRAERKNADIIAYGFQISWFPGVWSKFFPVIYSNINQLELHVYGGKLLAQTSTSAYAFKKTTA